MTTTTFAATAPETASFVLALPAPVAADLRALSRRLDMTASAIAEHLLNDYLEVLELTEDQGGLGAWLDRLFEAEQEPSPRQAMLLTLPTWQFAALRSYAQMETVSVSIILTAMIGRSLRNALTSRRPGYLWDTTLVELLAEHHGEFLAA